MGAYLQTSPDTPGECDEPNHKGWIELVSFDHGVRQVNVLNGFQGLFGPGGAEIEDFTVVMVFNKAVPPLVQYCCEAKPFDSVTVDLCSAAGQLQPYMQIILTDTVISHVQYGGLLAGASNRPEEIGRAHV